MTQPPANLIGLFVFHLSVDPWLNQSLIPKNKNSDYFKPKFNFQVSFNFKTLSQDT